MVTITINLLIQIIMEGILSGLIYGMFALGLSIIWGVSRIINVAHGVFIIVGAYVAVTLIGIFGLELYLYPIFAIVSGIIVGIIGIIVQYLLYSRLKGNVELNSLIISFGLSVLISASLVLLFTGDFVAAKGEYAYESTKVAGFLLINHGQVIAATIALIVFAVTYFFIEKTEIGRAIKAVAQDREVAPLMGINNKRIYLLAMFVSAFIAGLSGTVAITINSISPYSGSTYLGWSFAITVLAGLGNIQGILISGVIIGVARALVGIQIPGIEESVGFFIMFLVLLIRPRGLFGRVTE